MSRKQRLAQRRAMLIAECGMQRTMLQMQSRQLGLNTGWIKSGDGLLAKLKSIPAWAGLLMAAVVIIVPGKVTSIARSGLMLWQLWRSLKPDNESNTSN